MNIYERNEGEKVHLGQKSIAVGILNIAHKTADTQNGNMTHKSVHDLKLKVQTHDK